MIASVLAVAPTAAAALVPPVVAALAASAVLVVALALDLAVGEPPRRVHPVALFGAAVAPLDRDWNRPEAAGVAIAAVLPLAAAVALGGVVAVAGVAAAAVGLGPAAATVATILVAGAALSLTVSPRMLAAVAGETVELTETDPEAARETAVALVGRDTDSLSPAEIRSAAVESAAENLADGVVAPLCWFVAGATVGVALLARPELWGAGGDALAAGSAGGVGGSTAETAFTLSLGVAAAGWSKAVNTLDSMLGYRSKPAGRASARLDDAVMYLPARASAVCLAVAARSPRILRRARPLAREPSSPNSGWPMATAAVALGVRLEKPGAYVLDGGAEPPTPATARAGVRLVRAAGGVAAAAGAGWLLALATVVGDAGSATAALGVVP
ncbi:CobD/CbiB family cobalamin biosynthesis protein [Halorubrum sp. AS12]|uniref:CobD/CbiB family cobalamin biosynthesis protein n=1 Tax=Halorubrum sp. AS12 TaxID=3409687 RepID=UPI003DA6ED7E